MVEHSRATARSGDLRPLNLPRPLTVEADAAGRPLAVTREGIRQDVVRIRDVWQIEVEWWRDPVARRYFLVVLDDGVILAIFQDLIAGDWHEQSDR